MIKDDKIKIKVENLSKNFGDKQVLKQINLEVKEGKSLVVIGGSGSGKSVLIKTIIGLIKSTSGKVFIDGEEVSKFSNKEYNKLMRKFGMLFQGGALFDSLPVWKNIAFIDIQNKTKTDKQAYELAVEKLEQVGLRADVAALYPAELSGGMQKRVSLARSIAHNPKIIFFDEPTTGLDPIMADVINNLIVKCKNDLGATTITITHDMHSVRKIADEVAYLYEGKFIWHDKLAKMDKSKNKYLNQFIHGIAEGPIEF